MNAHLCRGAITNKAIRDPTEVGFAQQRQVVQGVQCAATRQQRPVTEHVLAVNCTEQRRGIAEHERSTLPRGAFSRCKSVDVLGLEDERLLATSRSALLRVTKTAQVLRDPGAGQLGCQRLCDCGFARAFGTEEANHPRRNHGDETPARRRCQPIQPQTANAKKIT